MGYRTSIKNINSIGHLIEGNVITFLQQSNTSDEMLITNIAFLDRIIVKTFEQFTMSEVYWNNLYKDLTFLRKNWNRIINRWKSERECFYISSQNNIECDIDNFQKFINNNQELLEYLQRVSSLFSKCKIKSMLLPGFEHGDSINKLLTKVDTLDKIVKIHPGNTALIVQFEEIMNREDVAILNVFSKFDKALQQIDNWPGVFLWNKVDALFIPIKSEEDLYEIFNLIKYEADAFDLLRERLERISNQKRYAYFFHLSDLHFGNKLANKRTLRIVRILENQMNKLDEDSIVIPLITGDLMQSPDDSNNQSYLQFLELLISKGFEKPIHILGNHDVDINGIKMKAIKQKAIISSLSSGTKIEIFEELKLAIIKFNSNTGGELAQGKIGEQQLMEIGNEIDAIKNKDSYTFIAMLHHHPLKIENPSWYAREWYMSLLGVKFFDDTLKLVDAELFLEWIERRGIKFVLHGHKHIPKIQKHEDITVIAAGSSSGSVKHKENGKTFLTYNLIKYDIDNRKLVSCTIIAEEVLGAGTKNMLVELF